MQSDDEKVNWVDGTMGFTHCEKWFWAICTFGADFRQRRHTVVCGSGILDTQSHRLGQGHLRPFEEGGVVCGHPTQFEFDP